MAGFPPFFNIPNPVNLVKQFYIFKDNAKQELTRNNLAAAHQWYNAALSFFQQPYIPDQIVHEHHVILCNRSQVCYRQRLYQQSEQDAKWAISICPTYVKAYWRASQAILSISGDRTEEALELLATAFSLVLDRGGNEQDQRHFLTEICILTVKAKMTDSMQDILCNLYVPDDRDKIWVSVIKKLCDQNQWESMAMLLIHYDPRLIPHPLNMLDTSCWQCTDINVGKLVSSLPDDKFIVYGEKLAICLLRKGASLQTIESETKTNSLHFLVNLSVRIGSLSLLKYALENYECIREKRNDQDDKGNTALHLAVKAQPANVDIRMNLVVVLLENKCDPSLTDATNKKPVCYVSEESKLFHFLKEKSNPDQELRSRLDKLKAEGNKAFQRKDFPKALLHYDEALTIAQQSPDLFKEAAILFSNRANVRHKTGDLENALANAMAAVNADPEYSKGYYWYSKALVGLGSVIEAFKTAIEGCSKSKIKDSIGDLLTEAAIILKSLKGDVFIQCYEMLEHQPSDIWSIVLTLLSKKSEWESIAYLIFGTKLDTFTFDGSYTGGRIEEFCKGVAGKCSTADVETRSVFNFLKRIDQNPTWLDALMVAVYTHGGEQTLKNFSENVDDCPLHAVLRFVCSTRSISLLTVFPHNGPKWCDKNSTDESGFHIIAKQQPSTDVLENMSKTLIMKGYSDILERDKKGKIPFDHLHDKYPYSVYNLFLPDNKPLEFKHVKRLCDIGKQKHDNGELTETVLVFTKVLRLKVKTDSDVNYRNVETLHAFALKTRADSNLKLGEAQKALTDANKSLNILASYDEHLIRAKASAALKRYDTAFKDFVQAFQLASYSQTFSEVQNICKDIVRFLYHLPNERCKSMVVVTARELHGNGHLWARVCHDFVLQNEWKVGEIAYYLFKNDRVAHISQLSLLSLKPFCSLKDIKCHNWSADMMLYYLHCGADKRTISLEDGDTYLHAAVRISLVASFPDLLYYLLSNASLNDLLVCDKEGNTLLHTATREKKVDKKARYVVIEGLLAYRVDAQMLNKEKRTAASYLSGENKNKDLIMKDIQRHNKGNQKAKFNRKENRDQQNGTNGTQRTRKERKRKCEKCEELYASALSNITTDKARGLKEMTKVLAMDHMDKFHSSIEKKVVQDMAKCIETEEDLNVCLTQLRTKEKFYTIINELFVSRKWPPLVQTIKAYNKQFSGRDLKNFASKFTIEPLVVDTTTMSDDDEIAKVCCLLDNGWQIGDEDGKVTLRKIFEIRKIKLGVELIKRGANMSEMSLNEGDTPIHALTVIVLQIKDSTLIEDVLDKWSNDKVRYSYLDPEQVDANGDCIYHILAKSEYSDMVLQITEKLCEKNVSADFYNKECKYASEYVKKKHFRLLDFLKTARRIKASRKQIDYKTTKEEGSATAKAESPTDQKLKSKLSQTSRKEQIQEARNNIEHLISKLPAFIDVEEIEAQKNIEIKHENVLKGNQQNPDDSPNKQLTSSINNEQLDNNQGAKEISEEADYENDDMSETPILESEDIRNAKCNRDMSKVLCGDSDNEGDEQVSFENLPWEVECTDKVLKVLEDKQVMPQLKEKIVVIIKMLASGDWQRHLCKELTNVPKSLKLYEAKLSKGRRIIWENAISFSSRCSDTADNRLKLPEHSVPNVRGGRIYSQLIRVWDVVMDHDKIRRSVDNIKFSHQRGITCTIQRKLKGLRENEERLKTAEKTYPLLFTENDPDAIQNTQDQVQHIPPASSNKTEYHILKFYPVDTLLVKHFLQNSDVKVDFPFKVTDLEHAVINLTGKDAILLLGRSGTGKTTCCLYRLWSQYRSYWINRQIDDPLLPGPDQTQCQRNAEYIDENTGASIDCCDDKPENYEDKTENTDADTENTDTNTENTGIEDYSDGAHNFEHFHQMFITKNQVLAAEVKKTFRDFKNAETSLSAMHSENIDQPLPNCLQDLKEHDYPLFITSRQMLCKLDASIGDPFFKREEDGSMVNRIEGWEGSDEGLTGLHLLDYDSDDEIGVKEANDTENETNKRKRENDVRREVTYEVFENEIWRKIECKTKGGYHPSLVWTEIMSFIKGSYESLSSKSGYLSKDEYMDLGRKRAPNFSGQRDDIYDIFLSYEHYKKNHQLFDETDVVHDIFRRLARQEVTPITIHQIYVDETQDFTQAELFLLIRLCKNPNDMFLTGDTAQSIMRGIAFRFEDLKTLFFHVKQMTKEANSCSKSKSLEVNVPQLHQLTYNYRSHSGILSLASSILEILVKFFPESFDRLEPDKGLFPGPEPILIESCTFSDLAVLISGNRRETSNIEFGAHQVILVYNDEAKESLPEELSCGLVLTIYESKGLEFDDVLLFNFFKYSQASKEWRVVTQHLNELAEAATVKSSQTEQCVRIDNELLMSKGRPRPLDFDPNQHKILCSELKQLYTALTRARVNVWIYDEDPEKRGPMFEYFKALKLVKPVDITELNEESLSKVIFAENSSNQDWIKQGDSFMKNRLYSVAAQCFGKGGDRRKQMLAQAHDRALMASRRKTKFKEKHEMRDEFLFAAELYLNCERYSEAAICLNNATEMKSAVALYTKLGQFEKAAEICKRNGRIVECSRLYESADKFNKAVSILCENGVYDIALDVLKRYKMRETEIEKNDSQSLENLRANKPDKIYTVEKISLRAAERYHGQKDLKRMHEAVSRFRDDGDKIEFYKKHCYIDEAANLIAKTGKFPEAVQLYLKHGYLEGARKMAEKSNDDIIIAKSLLCISRIILATEKETEDNDIVKEDLRKSLAIFEKLRDRNLTGQVLLLHAELYGDFKYVISAGKEFLETRPFSNEAGYVECCNLLQKYIENENPDILDFLLKGVNCLFNVCSTFLQRFNTSIKMPLSEQKKFVAYCHFYGIFQKGESHFEIFPTMKPLCEKMFRQKPLPDLQQAVRLDAERYSHTIVQYLLREGKPWLKKVKNILVQRRLSLQLCESFKIGEECTGCTADQHTCTKLHQPYTKQMFRKLIETDVHLAEFEVSINITDQIMKLCESKHSKKINHELSDISSNVFRIKENEKHMACKFLLSDCLLHIGHPAILAEDSRYILNPARSNKIALEHMKQYLVKRWNESTCGDRMLDSRAAHETEVFLLFEFAYHLYHLDAGKIKFDKKPKDYMLSFEHILENELKSEGNPKRFKQKEKSFTLVLSILPERAFLTSIAHRFTDAYEHLIKGNPFDAVFSFGKFQTMLSQRTSQGQLTSNFYPEIHHYLFWLEFYCTLAFLIVARLKSQVDPDHSIILPNTYIAMLHFVESTFPRGSTSLINSISQWIAPKREQRLTELILERIKRFAFVISGHAQNVKIPNIIEDACKVDKANFLLLERLLILNMILLCNIGNSVPIECQNSLIRSLNNHLFSPDRTERLEKVHDPDQQLENAVNVIGCLDKLLQLRKLDESLIVIKWIPKLKEQIDVKPLDRNALPSVFLKHLLVTPSVETQKSVEDLPDDTEQTEDEIRADLQEKEAFDETQEKDDIPIHTSDNFDLSNSVTLDHEVIGDKCCYVCDINFDEHFLARIMENGPSKPDETSQNSQQNESSSRVFNIKRQESMTENAKAVLERGKHYHAQGMIHQQNLERLQSFQNSYKNDVEPIMTEAEKLIQQYNTEEKHSETYKMEMKGIQTNHEKIKEELNEIRIFAEGWQKKQKHVLELILKLRNDIESLKSYQEEQSKETKIQYGSGDIVGNEIGDVNNDAEGNDIEDVVQEPIQLRERIQSKRKRKNERRKNKARNK